MTPVNVGEGHVTELEIAAYLDGGLASNERKRVEMHLAHCEECRDDLVNLDALVTAQRRPRRFLINASLLAAAAVIAIVAVPSVRSFRTPEVPVTRDIQSSVISIFSPAFSVDRKHLRFTWSSVPGALDYRVVVALGDGTTLWSTRSTDTTVVPPAAVAFDGGREYVWSADAELENGDVVSSGLRKFSISR